MVIVKPACPAAKEIADGAKPVKQMAKGRSIQNTTSCDPNSPMMIEPMMMPSMVPGQRLHDRLAGTQRVGPENRQGAKDDPEGVLDAEGVGHPHAETDRDRGTRTVVQPD